ncbi:MAG TPA: DUF3459 domain-containing protein, partial [Vicinamibacterales bacterium]|nr:DUF3459 domain-containing protein [Vicinamibacterales bacterium]
DAVWADDFHHEVRRLVAGDADGYYRDFTGTVTDLAQTINEGWFYRGQYSEHLGAPRGTDPTALAPHRFIVCIQNHDQVGNRARGDRLNHDVDPAVFRAISALLLWVPETPLLFMGQEWAAGTPFLYFTDHHADLGRLVTEGRRNEFRHFARFADPAAAAQIPDPQAPSTFEASRLQWDERDREPHAAMLRLYRALIALRRHEPALRRDDRSRFSATALEPDMLLLRREAPDGSGLLAVFRFRGSGPVEIRAHLAPTGNAGGHPSWVPLLTTEDPRFAPDAMPLMVEIAEQTLTVDFPRPGAVVFRTA